MLKDYFTILLGILAIALLSQVPAHADMYVAPTASLTGSCYEINGTITGGSEEEWFQLAGPDGIDIWGGSVTLQPNESRTFTEYVADGTYNLYTTPVSGGDTTLTASVTVECAEEEVVETTTDGLADTGAGEMLALVALGLCLLGAGAWITKKYGWMN